MKKLAGRHLILDVIVNDIEYIASEEAVNKFMKKVSQVIGMTLVYPPLTAKFPFCTEITNIVNELEHEGTTSPVIKRYVDRVRARDTNDNGVSSVSVWLESHLAFHSWTDNKYASLDLFSCKKFDAEPAIDLIVESFDVKKADILSVIRYMGSPQEVTQETRSY